MAREIARRDLLSFTEYTKPDFQPSSTGHHALIAAELDKVARGEVDRLMIFAPPRHTKSELASRRFPAYYLGKYPNRQIIAASYGGELASDFGYDVKSIIESPEYQDLFDLDINADRSASTRFLTSKKGVYIAAGVGGPITGRGAHVLIIDDPYKDAEDADSTAVRRKVKRWFQAVAYPRLMPGGAIVVVLTRWRDDDLAGWLIDEAEIMGEDWRIIELPAIARDGDAVGRAPGEALWPDWYPIDKLEKIKRVLGPRQFSALYQQQPVPDEGEYFKRDWFHWYEWNKPPAHLHIYGASDYAVTDDGGDYTVHGVVGVDPTDKIYVLDWWRERTSSAVWIETLLDLAALHKPLVWAGEKGQIFKSLEPIIRKRMRERKVFLNLAQYASAADKPTRAQAIRARMENGMLYFPSGAPFMDDLMHEILRFPMGSFDDQVDVLSLFGRMISGMSGGVVPKKEPEPRFKETLDEMLKIHDHNIAGREERI